MTQSPSRLRRMRPQVCPRASAPRLLPSFRLAFPRPGPATKLSHWQLRIIRIYLTSGVCCSCTKRIVRCTQGEDNRPCRPPWSPDQERFLGSRRLTSPTCRVIPHVDPAAIFFPCQLVITDGPAVGVRGRGTALVDRGGSEPPARAAYLFIASICLSSCDGVMLGP